MKTLITFLMLAAFGVASLPATAASAEAASEEGAKVTSKRTKVVRWVDGDTVVTSRGTVRLIGVDTPEAGKCGSKKATRLAKRLAPAGTRIKLGNPSSVDNADRYGRQLRYVSRGSTDIGLRQIKAGAVARYDSLDGYDRHPRQRRYHRVDRKHRNYKCKGGGKDLNSYPPVPGTWDCPEKAPIKGNQGSPEWIYHMPWNAYYDATNPEECFATEAGAVKAGYRAAKI